MLDRSEYLFIYDVKDSNPNGDPLDENKPRIDEETGQAFVTDVRLKRTIRDYLHNYMNEEIFIIGDKEGNAVTKKSKLEKYKNNQEVIEKWIDIRLFGATTAVTGRTMAITGPVQFNYGRSMHKVDLTYVKGTTVMSSKEGNKQGTFTEKYILPYALIAFHGVLNERAAENQSLNLTEEDVNKMIKGLWYGTKNLMSNSKMGHMPRLLIEVEYNEKFFHIGELDKLITYVSDKEDIKIRDIKDGYIEVSSIIDKFNTYSDKIKSIRVMKNDRVIIKYNGENIDLINKLKEININVENIEC
jgi:CRISPR-associated protein Csh2